VIIASWNVNSIKVRLPILQDWLKTVQPDVVLLQEIKCETDVFPLMEIQSMGYQACVSGQKTYNGVAVLTKEKAEMRTAQLPGNADDPQARYLEVSYKGWVIASIYLPNGNPMGTDKFTYKLNWLQRLNAHAQNLLKEEKPVVLGGDYNVIPAALDAQHPEKWVGDALYQPESRGAWQSLQHKGYYDAFRTLHPGEPVFTFWDYQNSAWLRDDGIRIDHLLCSPEATDRLQKSWVDKNPRSMEKASDHTPILAHFS
jgi:exodeoxyribonuclease-3